MHPPPLLEQLIDFLTARRVDVLGESMSPTVPEGARLAISSRAYRHRQPARFDIVLVRSPNAEGRHDLKRIVGLPGEDVVLSPGGLFIDHRRVEQPHLERGASAALGRFEWHVGADTYVVLGDNRGRSTDSRHYGPISRDRILGRVVRRF